MENYFVIAGSSGDPAKVARQPIPPRVPRDRRGKGTLREPR